MIILLVLTLSCLIAGIAIGSSGHLFIGGFLILVAGFLAIAFNVIADDYYKGD